MKKIRNLFLASLLAIALVALVGCGEDAANENNGVEEEEEKGTVSLGYVEWDSEVASTNVVKTVLEDEGYDVELISLGAAVMFTGMGEGDFDGMVAAWLPTTHGEYFDAIKDNVEDLGPNLEGTAIGLVVPDYVDIDSIEELNENADKFDNRIIGIEPGAGLMVATEEVIEEYELELDLIDGTGATMAASLKDAIDNEEWVVVTGWTPHWKFSRWDLKYLDDSKLIYGEAEEINTIVRPDLKDDMPEVYSILDNFYWSPDDMAEVMVEIEAGTKADVAARNWVDANQDTVSKWVE